jgi:hypothetical protein
MPSGLFSSSYPPRFGRQNTVKMFLFSVTSNLRSTDFSCLRGLGTCPLRFLSRDSFTGRPSAREAPVVCHAHTRFLGRKVTRKLMLPRFTFKL